jgi:hypothetical protein
MFDPVQVGKLAAMLHKKAAPVRQGRAGRNVKGTNMQKHLHAAGQPKMNTPGVFAFPRGQSV